MKTTHLGSMVFLFWLFSSGIQAAPVSENNAKIPILTRLVGIFAGLETDIIAALKNKNLAKLENLVAEDFEMRTALMPDTPVPRAEWLKVSMLEAPAYSSDMEQMVVHDFNDTALVSFLWHPSVADDLHKGIPKIFVVDTWRHEGAIWLLTIRYISVAGDASVRIPGFSQNEPLLEKKY